MCKHSVLPWQLDQQIFNDKLSLTICLQLLQKVSKPMTAPLSYRVQKSTKKEKMLGKGCLGINKQERYKDIPCTGTAIKCKHRKFILRFFKHIIIFL